MDTNRESIFFSSLRSFCNAFAVVLGIMIAGFILLLFLGMSGGSNALPPKSELTICPDAQGNRTPLSSSSPAVLKIDIKGVIGMHDLTREKIATLLLDSRDDMLSHDRVKAVLLHIDSPGGTVVDAEGIYQLLKDYKQKYHTPIYAFVDGLCASGGIYIACAADKIYATQPSIIGSVGVIQGPYFNVSDLMQQYGIQSKTLTEGKDKDALSPFRKWEPNEDASLVDIMHYFYNRFVSVVVEARPSMNKEKLVEEYGAHVFDGEMAMKHGYIDVANSSYEAALSALVQTTGLTDTDHYQVVSLHAPHSLLSQLTESGMSLFKGKVEHTFAMGPYMNSELSGKFLYLYKK